MRRDDMSTRVQKIRMPHTHRAIDMACMALREVYKQLAEKLFIPEFADASGDSVAADDLHALDLFRHVCMPKVAAEFAASMQIPQASLMDAVNHMLQAMIMLARPGEWSDKRVTQVRVHVCICV
jgi:hypothetical protein